MTLLRVWLIGTAIFLVSVMAWAFAPILFVLLLVFVGLGAIVALIVDAARAYERRRGGGRPEQ